MRRRNEARILVPREVKGKLPPHDVDAEAAVVAACFDVGGAGMYDTVAGILKPEHFFADWCQIVFGSMQRLREAERPIDVVTVAHDLRDREQIQRVGGAKHLGEMLDATPSVANVEVYAEIVRDLYARRQLIATCQQVAAEGYGEEATGPNWLTDSEGRLIKATQHAHNGKLVPVSQLVREAYRRISQPDEASPLVYRTGLEAFDLATNGIGPGQLVIIAARPGMGKSGLVSDLAMLIAERCGDVPYFSLEMPKEEQAARFIAQRSWVPFSKVYGDEATLTAANHRAVTKATNELDGLPIYVDDTPGLSIVECQSKTRAAYQQAKRAGRQLGAVVVDYLQLMRFSREARTRDEGMGEITRGLKTLAKQVQAPVLALSQLNRGVETRGGKDKRPQLADLRESGNIEQDADKVIFIYRESYYDSSANKRRAELYAGKNRQDNRGCVEVGWAGWCMHFHNIGERTPVDEDTPEAQGAFEGL